MSSAREDVALAAVLALAVGALALAACATLDPRFLDPATGNDIWFEGDLGRIADEMTHRWAAHSRTPVHPLYSLLTVGATYLLRACGASPTGAVAGVVGISAAVWTAACFALFRALGARQRDTVLLLALSAVSASGVFWLPVPETAALGSASVMMAIAVGAVACKRPLREAWLIGASAASLAVTVTNWVAGVVAAFVALPWGRALQVSVNGFVLVVALWTVQRAVVPYASFFIGYSNEQRYLLRDEAHGPLTAIRAVAINGMMMPAITTFEKPGRTPIMTVQASSVPGQTLLWKAGAILWVLLVGWGAVTIARTWRALPQYRALVPVLACELALYAVYGTESFLYALNVVPLLAGVAAGGLRGAARRVVVGSIVALLGLALLNNATRAREARAYFTPAVAARIASMSAPTSVPSSAALR